MGKRLGTEDLSIFTSAVESMNGLCVGFGKGGGEVAHAAILCPSFYRAEIVQNPNAWDRFLASARATVIGWLQPA